MVSANSTSVTYLNVIEIIELYESLNIQQKS